MIIPPLAAMVSPASDSVSTANMSYSYAVFVLAAHRKSVLRQPLQQSEIRITREKERQHPIREDRACRPTPLVLDDRTALVKVTQPTATGVWRIDPQ